VPGRISRKSSPEGTTQWEFSRRLFSARSYLRAHFVIGSVPGFPAALLSPATSDVVLFEENHTQPAKAATLDRKSGTAEPAGAA
jgi:hypothetical protein